MSQWIRHLPLAPIHLAVLLLSFHFVLAYFSVLSVLILLGLFLLLCCHQGMIVVYKSLPLLACFFLLFGLQGVKMAMEEASAPAEVSFLHVKPDTIQVNGDSLSFQATSSGKRYSVFYHLKNQKEQTYFKDLSQLVRLEVEATVSVPEGQRNFNGFDYRNYLRTRGIYRTVKIIQIKQIQPQVSYNPLDWLSLLRRKALVYLKKHFPNPMRHYMAGLLFGDLDKEFEPMSSHYSSLGIIHLFALSGMQVGFFVEKFRFLFLRLGVKKEVIDWLQIPFSFLYAGLTGFSISVNRSLLQKIFANMGITQLDNLACTMIVCFLLTPHFLLTAGGVLSFAYAFLLTVLDVEYLCPMNSKMRLGNEGEGITSIHRDDWMKYPVDFRRVLLSYRRVVVESLAVSFGMLPLLIYYFYSFHPLSILLTFLFSLLFDQVLLPGLSLIFLLSPFVILKQVNLFFGWLEAAIQWVVDLGIRPLIFGKPTPICLLILVLLLFFLHDVYRDRKWRLRLIVLLSLLLFMGKHPLENEITVVDVGQGDSIFFRDVRGRTILIDVGGRVSVPPQEDWRQKVGQANAKQTLIPYLHSRGVSKIDYLILTHAHADHMGDLEEVAKEMEVGRVYISEGSATNWKLRERLEKVGLHPYLVKVGDTFPICDGFLRVLYPHQKGDGGNNDSVVLYGELLQTRFLFTGDLEDGELELMKQYPQMSVDVLKAGHHGAKGSSYPAFLDAISPRITLISAGKNNRYQHPHQETLSRFQERQIQVFRTDEQGAIRFRGWKKWTIETVR